jgi:hypothetical protein
MLLGGQRNSAVSEKIGNVVSSEDPSGWNDNHLPSNNGCVLLMFFTVDLDFVEEDGDVVVTFTETTEIVCYFVWNFEE